VTHVARSNPVPDRVPADAAQVAGATSVAATQTDRYRQSMTEPVPFALPDTDDGRLTSMALSLSGSEPLLLDSFEALFRHAHPPMALLISSKDFAKANLIGYRQSRLPWPVSRVIYLASIAKAHLRWGVRITRLSDRQLLKSMRWAAGQSWLSDELTKLFAQYERLLQTPPRDTRNAP